MIKIEKDLAAIPESLKPPILAFFPLPGKPSRKSKTTHLRRLKVIGDNHYTDNSNFNSRYKQQDIQDSLKLIYKSKCAFCEQKIELSHVEHYRPKDIYPWLAYSWDNLILSCPHCNTYKGTDFEIIGGKANFVNNPHNLQHINNLSAGYNQSEQPTLVNPETTDPAGQIRFLQTGGIESDNLRFTHTINTCRISRQHLNDERRKLINDFRDDLAASIALSNNKDEKMHAVRVILNKFTRDTQKDENQFLAFRQFAIANNWLTDIIKSLVILNPQ